jgi:two-component system sensor histidine kinase ChvG
MEQPSEGQATTATPLPKVQKWHERRLSRLTLRILGINVLALGILLGGLLFLDQYREGLIEAKIAALEIESGIIAGAIGAGAVAGPPGGRRLDAALSAEFLRRLVRTQRTRALLFDSRALVMADSRRLGAAGRRVEMLPLPLPGGDLPALEFLARWAEWLTRTMPGWESYPPYREQLELRALYSEELGHALAGHAASSVRETQDGGLIVSVAMPVQRFKRVLGALVLTAGGADIQQSVRQLQLAIGQVFALALGVTVLLSLYLAGTIVRPIRQLAAAAEMVRRRPGQRAAIPDFSSRRDEIGELSAVLGNMTAVLYDRLKAIEAFAADVAHEVRNPITSIRSAVETLERGPEPAQQQRLMAIIADDVQRLDRLIGDIADASRLDAELARAEAAPVDLEALARTLVEIERTEGRPEIDLNIAATAPGDYVVPGLEGRLGQVLRNLLDNAFTFSPPDSVIELGLQRRDDRVRLLVEDRGPGLPEEKLEAVFERFYSERPEGEAFGRHSGLGLSISRQIVEAHGGTIWAENRHDAEGAVVGARIVVELPV